MSAVFTMRMLIVEKKFYRLDKFILLNITNIIFMKTIFKTNVLCFCKKIWVKNHSSLFYCSCYGQCGPYFVFYILKKKISFRQSSESPNLNRISFYKVRTKLSIWLCVKKIVLSFPGKNSSFPFERWIKQFCGLNSFWIFLS